MTADLVSHLLRTASGRDVECAPLVVIDDAADLTARPDRVTVLHHRRLTWWLRERPEVLDCYTTMGEWDFMLRIVTKDIKAYEAFYLDHLSKLPNVQSINSSVTVTVIKETTVLPIE